MEKNIRFKFNPADLFVQRRGKVLLLDKQRNWQKTPGLIPGHDYIIKAPEIKELEKCKILTNGIFIDIQSIEPVRCVEKIFISFKKEGEDHAVSFWFEDRKIIDGEAVDTKTVYGPNLSWRDCKNHEVPEYKEFHDFYEGVLSRGNDTFIGTSGQDLVNDFLNKVEYKKVKEKIFPTTNRQDTIKFVDGKISVLFKTQEEYIKVGTGSQHYRDKNYFYVPIEESGLEHEIIYGPKCPTRKNVTVKLTETGEEYKIFLPGDGSGSFMQYAYELGYVTAPKPEVLADFRKNVGFNYGPTYGEIQEWAQKGRLFFSDWREEFAIGGFDGTDYLFDKIPGLYETVKNKKEQFENCSMLVTPVGFFYIPYEKVEDYDKELEKSIIHAKWRKDFGSDLDSNINDQEVRYVQDAPKGSAKVNSLWVEHIYSQRGDLRMRYEISTNIGRFERGDGELFLTPLGMFFVKKNK